MLPTLRRNLDGDGGRPNLTPKVQAQRVALASSGNGLTTEVLQSGCPDDGHRLDIAVRFEPEAERFRPNRRTVPKAIQGAKVRSTRVSEE